MNIHYRVTLSSDERSELEQLIAGGKTNARKMKRTQILLAAASRSKDETIASNIGVGTSTVYRTKQRFVEEGLERAINEGSRPKPERKLSANEEALLVAVACSDPPKLRNGNEGATPSALASSGCFTVERAREKMGRAYPQPVTPRRKRAA